jgi:hypothetical protein
MRCQVDEWTPCVDDSSCIVIDENGDPVDLGPCVEVTIKKVWSSNGKFAALRKEKREKLKPLRWWKK